MPLNEATRAVLARYIDGQLVGAALTGFQRRLAEEPEVAAELARLQQVNASLQRMFPARGMTAAQVLSLAQGAEPMDVPSSAGDGASDSQVESVLPRVATWRAAPQTAGSIAGWIRRLAVAAVLVGGLFGGWMTWRHFNPPPPPAPVASVGAKYYQLTVKRGFEPDWVCKNDQEFADTFQQRLGQAMALKPMPTGSRMLGLGYNAVLSPLTISMLADVDGKQVIVLVDKTSTDNPERVNVGCIGLHQFRKEVGGLVLYELTPLDQPHVMDSLYQP